MNQKTVKSYLGGLKAVIKTDTIQGSLQNPGIIILFIVLFIMVGGYRGASELALAAGSPEPTNVFKMPVRDLLVFLLTLGGYQLIRQDTWQRIWAARDIKVVIKAIPAISYKYLTPFPIPSILIKSILNISLGPIKWIRLRYGFPTACKYLTSIRV